MTNYLNLYPQETVLVIALAARPPLLEQFFFTKALHLVRRTLARTLCITPTFRLWWPVLFLMTITGSAVPAQRITLDEQQFYQLSIANGLPNNTINVIFQDRWGFMWFGTEGGLAKYDGYSVSRYKAKPSNPHAIWGRRISAITEDPDGNLWIGSEWGLHRLDRALDRFQNFPLNIGTAQENRAIPVHDMLADQKGNIWVVFGKDHTLAKLDPSRGIFNHSFRQHPSGPDYRVHDIFHFRGKSALYEDGHGKIWIGLQKDGLACYQPDPGLMQHYRHDAGNPHSLIHNTVSSIHEDGEGNLWVGTFGGLELFDTSRRVFAHFLSDPEKKSALLNEKIYSIHEDHQGYLWIGKAELLERFDPRKRNFKAYWDFHYPEYDLTNNIFWVGESKPHHLYFWSNYDHRVHLYDHTADLLYEEFWPLYLPKNIKRDLNTVFIDRTGVLWLGTAYSGVLKREQSTLPIDHFKTDDTKATTLSHNVIRQFTEDQSGMVWIATEKGLNRFDPVTRQFQRFHHPAYDSLAVNAVLGTPGGLWIADAGGLSRLQADHPLYHQNLALHRPVSASSVEATPTPPEKALDGNPRTRWASSFSDPQWLAVDLQEETAVGRLVISWESGARRYDIESSKDGRYWEKVTSRINTFEGIDEIRLPAFRTRYLRFYGIERIRGWGYSIWEMEIFGPQPVWTPVRLANHPLSIRALTAANDGKFWLAGSGGIFAFHPHTTAITTIPALARLQNINTVHQDRSRRLWLIPTDGTPLYAFDPGTTVLHRYHPGQNGLETERMTGIFEERAGRVWILSREGGLYLYDPAEDRFARYLGNSSPSVVHEDQSGCLWVGTLQDGLYQLKHLSGTVTQYAEPEGLVATAIRSILEDERNRLWLGTDLGLSIWDPTNGKFINYYENHGLMPGGLNGPAFEDGHGNFYFAGPQGFHFFHPDSIRLDTTTPEVVFTDFQLFNQSVGIGTSGSPLSQSLPQTRQIELQHDQNVLSFTFAGLHYGRPQDNRYAVWMKGVDRGWNFIGRQRKVNYAGLDPGHYSLWVKASNADGVWNEKGTLLNLIIHPPWWASSWAYALYLGLGLSLFWIWYSFQQSRWKMRARLQRQEEESRRLKELDNFKSRLYTNITHEFRTPLTVIQGVAEQILEHPKQKHREQVGIIKRNTGKLLNLINQMLDLSKLESGRIKPQYVQGDIVNYLSYLAESFQSYAFAQNLVLSFHAEIEELVMDYDPEKLQNIMTNLIGNAIKFTPAYGSIKIVARKRKNNKAEFLEITVKDSGKGIPAHQLPYIFDRFYQGDDSTRRTGEGTGVGLALVQETVKLLKGSIQVTSELNKGSCFKIQLPIHQKADRRLAPTPKTYYPGKMMTSKKPSGTEPAPPRTELPQLLLVEDNQDVTYYLKGCLEGKYEITEAQNGREGLDKALAMIPDIILSDVMMPGMDGFDLVRKVKQDERTSHIPVILLTARATRQDKLGGLHLGADAYLTKPFDKAELLLRLDQLITLRRKLQIRYSQPGLSIQTSSGSYVKEDQFIQRLNRAIEQELENPNFDATELAKAMTMSKTQLYRKVKALTGRSVAIYIRARRLQRARELLIHTRHTVSAVAFQLGFEDVSYFSRVFKKEFGQTPSAVRHH